MGDELKKATLDDIFKDNKELGPTQNLIFFLYALSYLVTSMELMSWDFTGADLPHRCRLPDEQDLPNVTFNGDLSDSTCQIRLRNGTGLDCQFGFVYNTTLIGDSIVKEWNLVCNRGVWRAIIAAAPMIGFGLGGALLGQFSDRHGRKPAFLLSVYLLFVACLFSTFSWDVYSFALSRFLVGFAVVGVENSAYVMGLEVVGPTKRALAGGFCWLFEALGFMCTVGIAYTLNKSWRLLQGIYAIICLFFFSYYWIAPESIRWLLSRNRVEDAQDIVKKMAYISGKEIPEGLFDHFKAISKEDGLSSEKESLSMLILFSFKQLRNKTFLIGFIWIICAALYYVLLLDQSDLSHNPYVGFFVTSAIQIPGSLLSLLFLRFPSWGRRRTLSWSLILSGLCECLIPIIPTTNFMTIAIISTIGRFFAICAYNILYLFSTEQFPTTVRGIGLGFCSVASRFGSASAPFVLLIGHYAPLVFGISSLMAGLATSLLPETGDRDLPETIEDGEMIPLTMPKLYN